MDAQVKEWLQHAERAGLVFIEIERGLKGTGVSGWTYPKAEPDGKFRSADDAAQRQAEGFNLGAGLERGTTSVVLVDADDAEALEVINGYGSDTLSAKSPRGIHCLFSVPDGIEVPPLGEEKAKAAGLGKLGVRCGGSYCVAPGSWVDERAYRGKKPPEGDPPWHYTPLNIAPVQPIPPELAAKIQAAAGMKVSRAAPGVRNQYTITSGRHIWITEVAGRIFNTDMVEEDAVALAVHLGTQWTDLEKGNPGEVARTVKCIRDADRRNHPDRVRRSYCYAPDRNHRGEDTANRLAALGYAARWNTRKDCVEISKNGGRWEQAGNHFATIWNRVADECITVLEYRPWIERKDRQFIGLTKNAIGKDTLHLLLEGVARRVSVDPFRLYLDSLPPWDGTPRIDNILSRCFAVEPGYERSASWGVRSTVVGAAHRTYSPGYQHDTMFVVCCDKQGFGKSKFFATLLPEKDWFSDNLELHLDTKTMLERIGSTVICEAPEMVGAKKADRNRLKAFLTRQQDVVRWSYGRFASEVARRTVLVGTSNDPRSLPIDPGDAGRRYLPCAVRPRPEFQSVYASRTHVVNLIAAERDQLWAEALVAMKTENTAIPPELESYFERLVGEHVWYDEDLQRAVNEFVEGRPKDTPGHPYAGHFAFADAKNAVSHLIRSMRDNEFTPYLIRAGCESSRPIVNGKKVTLWHRGVQGCPDDLAFLS